MAKHSSPWLLVRWFRRSNRRRPTAGFTLIELLIAMFIGSIITSVLLYGVVELLKTNQRESSRAETQREMQLALDYISAELRQAVFVYDGGCLSGAGTFPANGAGCPGVTNFLPTSISSGSASPVLAFWRVDELPQTLISRCAASAASLNNTTNPPPTATGGGIGGVPCLSRRTYSLVVYYLDTANASNIWQGKARIRRYELTQFASTGAPNPGWVDPTTTVNNFLGWPFNAAGVNLQTAATLADGSTNIYQGAITGANANLSPPVLVDFVDDPITPASTANACPGDSAAAGSLPPFVRTPVLATTITSFYACVRGGGFTAAVPPVPNNVGGRNQEVALFLRGNAAGRSGVPSTAKVVFDLQTRTLSRGSLQKNPAPQ